MHDALEDALLRLQRADEHLDALKKERRSFLDQAAGRVSGRFEPHRGEYIAFIDGQPPRKWSPTISDFANQLRATLDNLVTGLVEQRGVTVTNAHGYPIAISSDYWKQGRCRAMIAGLTRADKEAIKAMQPYTRSHRDPNLDALAILRVLSDRDKHRRLFGCYVAVEGFTELPENIGVLGWPRVDKDVEVTHGSIGGAFNPYGPHTEFARVAVIQTGNDPQMSVEGHPPFDVALSNGDQVFPFGDLFGVRQAVEEVVVTLAPHFA